MLEEFFKNFSYLMNLIGGWIIKDLKKKGRLILIEILEWLKNFMFVLFIVKWINLFK